MDRSVRNGNYAIAVWMIKPGREEEFLSAWKDFATWTSESGAGALEGTLVQDVQEPRRFFCFWPFVDEPGINKWKGDAKHREFMMRMRAYCESHTPAICRTVGYVEGAGMPTDWSPSEGRSSRSAGQAGSR